MKTETDGRLLYLQISNYRPRANHRPISPPFCKGWIPFENHPLSRRLAALSSNFLPVAPRNSIASVRLAYWILWQHTDYALTCQFFLFTRHPHSMESYNSVTNEIFTIWKQANYALCLRRTQSTRRDNWSRQLSTWWLERKYDWR